MDKKSKNYDEESIEKMAKKSIIYHTERSNVAWGGYSLVNAEMILLRKATEVGYYEYYGAAEPPVRCGESHLSGLTEPPHFVY